MTAYTINPTNQDSPSSTHWLELVEQLGRQFSERSQQVDENDRFVFENYVDLKAHGFVSLGVPQALGGAGLNHAQLCEILYELGQYCGSTALAFAMHTHQVATAAWRWEHQNAPVEGLLRRVANENIIILSSGGSDWLEGSGQAERVEGGFVINAARCLPVAHLLAIC